MDTQEMSTKAMRQSAAHGVPYGVRHFEFRCAEQGFISSLYN